MAQSVNPIRSGMTLPDSKKTTLSEVISIESAKLSKSKDDSKAYDCWLSGCTSLCQDPSMTRSFISKTTGEKITVNKVLRVEFDSSDQDSYRQARSNYLAAELNRHRSRNHYSNPTLIRSYPLPTKYWDATKTKQKPVLGFGNQRPPTVLQLLKQPVFIDCTVPTHMDLKGNWKELCLGAPMRKLDSLDNCLTANEFEKKGRKIQLKYLNMSHHELIKYTLKKYKRSKVYGSRFQGPPLPPTLVKPVVGVTQIENIAKCALPYWDKTRDPRYERWKEAPAYMSALARMYTKDYRITLDEAINRGYCINLFKGYSCQVLCEDPDNYMGNSYRPIRLWSRSNPKQNKTVSYEKETFKSLATILEDKKYLPVPVGNSYHSSSVATVMMRPAPCGRLVASINKHNHEDEATGLSSESIAIRYLAKTSGEVNIDKFLQDIEGKFVVANGILRPKTLTNQIISKLYKNKLGIYIPYDDETELEEGIEADPELALSDDIMDRFSEKERQTIVDKLMHILGIA